ncbi:hypothetical protein [Nostoc sp. NOS(2021)]|uniref:hypothetical protein n=1 Tax=Nostoc sp. NOS(2021) TaxID=2815407 RepID=UPI0025DD1AC9|nr:hypothetical protein [Nostoc sp. NOS(2021)]
MITIYAITDDLLKAMSGDKALCIYAHDEDCCRDMSDAEMKIRPEFDNPQLGLIRINSCK